MTDEAIEATRKLVGFVAGGVDDDVVSAGVVDFVAAEGFFEVGETKPGVVFGGVFGGDAPKIKSSDSLCFGVENCFGQKSDSGGEFFEFAVSG